MWLPYGIVWFFIIMPCFLGASLRKDVSKQQRLSLLALIAGMLIVTIASFFSLDAIVEVITDD